MNKLLKNILLTAFCLSLNFSSGCTTNDKNNTGEDDFTLVSTNPKEKATVSASTNAVSFVFDKPVYVADKTKISLNGTPISNTSATGSSLTVTLNLLVSETEYTVLIDIGAIKDSYNNLNKKAFTLHFSTEKKPEITSNLVMPNASAQAKKVYQFLLDNYGKKIISGAMARVNWNTDEADRVYRWTGKYPALNCFDYIHLQYSPANWIDYGNTAVVEGWWNNGGLVMACWHWNVPATPGSDIDHYSFNTSGTTFDVSKAVQDGTDENAVVKADLEKVANYLLLLQAKNIPVIWRPLHEASGKWFWWGAKGAELFKALWKLMFDTFKAKGINNLIWVWTSQINDPDWYPGDGYVDAIGCDIYTKPNVVDLVTPYQTLATRYPQKMITLSECGAVAAIPDQWNNGAQWSWFMPWYDYNATDDGTNIYATKEYWQNAFAFDKVITRDKMPSLK